MDKNWIEKMDMKKGALHRQMGVSNDYTFNKSKLTKINKTGVGSMFEFEGKNRKMTPLLKKRITLAITLMGFRKQKEKYSKN